MVTKQSSIDFVIYGEKQVNDKYDVFLGFDITNKKEAYIKLYNSAEKGVYEGLRFRFTYQRVEHAEKRKVYYADRETIIAIHHDNSLTIKGRGPDTHYIVYATFNNVYHNRFGKEYMWTSIFGNVFLKEDEKMYQDKCYEVKVRRRAQGNEDSVFYIDEIPKEAQTNSEFSAKFREFMASTMNLPHASRPEIFHPMNDSKAAQPSTSLVLPQFSRTLSEIKTVPKAPHIPRTRNNKKDVEFMKKEIKNENVILLISVQNAKAWNRNVGIIPLTLTENGYGENYVTPCWCNAKISYGEVTEIASNGCTVTRLYEKLELFKTYLKNSAIYVEDDLKLDKQNITEVQKKLFFEHLELGKILLSDSTTIPKLPIFEEPHRYVFKFAGYRADGIHWVVHRIEPNLEPEGYVPNTTEHYSRMNPPPPSDVMVYQSPERTFMRHEPPVAPKEGIVCRNYSDYVIVYSQGSFSSLNTNNRNPIALGTLLTFDTTNTVARVGCDSEVIESTINIEGEMEWFSGEQNVPMFSVMFEPHANNTPEYIHQDKLGDVMVSKKNSVFGRVLEWLNSPPVSLRGRVTLSYDESTERYKWVLVEVEQTQKHDLQARAQDSLHLLYSLWKNKYIRERTFYEDRDTYNAIQRTLNLQYHENAYIEH